MIQSLFHEHPQLIWWMTAISALMFFGSLFVVPWLVIRIPEDYFVGHRPPKSRFAGEHPVLRWTLRIARNLLGVILILPGIVMLIGPGQGVLTLVIAMMLLDYPGKRSLEQRIIRWKPVLRSINWLRRRAHRKPLQLHDEQSA